MGSPQPLLVESSPSTWLAAYRPSADGGDVSAWVDRRRLLAGGADAVVNMHRRLVESGTRPAAAACYLAEWIGGTLAGHVGHALALGQVGFEVEPDTVRWHRHPDGWMDGVDLSRAVAVVDDGHPWAGRPDVVTVATPEEVTARAVRAVIATVRPVIEAIRPLAPVGRIGLWNEVADGFAMAICFDRTLPVHPSAVDVLLEAIRHPGRPWTATPTITISTATFGPCYVAQKGGCCLAYTNTTATTDAEYCSTCRFRTWEDCERRQLDRFEEHAPPPE